MKKSIVSVLALAALGVAAVPAGGAPAEISSTAVFWHAQSGNVMGTPVGDGAEAKLVRTENGISYSMQTTGLRAGHAYTVWVVVINNPSACTASPCSPADILLSSATNSTVLYGTGHVVGGSGKAGFGGHVKTGPLPEGWIAGRGLENPLGADIHLVLNDHGPVLTEFMPEMTHTYRAGCTDASLPPIFPPTAKADGTPGPNTCRLWQAAVFD